MSDADVEDFAQKTTALLDVLLCPQCGSMATKLTNDKSAYACSCKKQQMTPLKA